MGVKDQINDTSSILSWGTRVTVLRVCLLKSAAKLELGHQLVCIPYLKCAALPQHNANVVNLIDRVQVISDYFLIKLCDYLMQNICLYLLQTIVSQYQVRSTCIYAFQ